MKNVKVLLVMMAVGFCFALTSSAFAEDLCFNLDTNTGEVKLSDGTVYKKGSYKYDSLKKTVVVPGQSPISECKSVPPSKAEPTKPEPTKPGPTKPGPTKPEPTRPVRPEPTKPVKPEPTKPVKPEPTKPVRPEPTRPEPVKPVPDEEKPVADKQDSGCFILNTKTGEIELQGVVSKGAYKHDAKSKMATLELGECEEGATDKKPAEPSKNPGSSTPPPARPERK